MMTVTRYRNVSVTLHTFNTPSTSVEYLLEKAITSSENTDTPLRKRRRPPSEKAVNDVHSVTGKSCRRQNLPVAEKDITEGRHG
jgi:hypothetical protein